MSLGRSSNGERPLRTRAEWIARFLWAPDRHDRHNEPLYGRTRLQKAMFLVHRKLDEEFGVDAGFDFEAYKYGPFDNGIYDAVTFMENQGYLRVRTEEEHDHSYEMREYKLTEEGESWARELYGDIPEEQQELLRWVKVKHALKKLGRLITYVYNEYPDMTENSELV
jgi:uncharacterized protein YwgA